MRAGSRQGGPGNLDPPAEGSGQAASPTGAVVRRASRRNRRGPLLLLSGGPRCFADLFGCYSFQLMASTGHSSIACWMRSSESPVGLTTSETPSSFMANVLGAVSQQSSQPVQASASITGTLATRITSLDVWRAAGAQFPRVGAATFNVGGRTSDFGPRTSDLGLTATAKRPADLGPKSEVRRQRPRMRLAFRPRIWRLSSSDRRDRRTRPRAGVGSMKGRSLPNRILSGPTRETMVSRAW